MHIALGTDASGKAVRLDLDRLIRTRLLVQANSGGGKSYLLRRIAEQLFGKIPVLLIDPEGEFATLRERFGYVLVGKGGETPAHPQSAALLAQRLLELQASAVCDLYEMPVRERHRWIRLFVEALIDAPKHLWRPTVVVVDEAHAFAPEKGHGESEASDAMIGLATRGRKRGFACIFATQRLGKLRKDVAAELLNVLIGQTFVDIDRKRAAEALGIPAREERAFFDQVKVMEPGSFWALGRALAMERVLIRVGPVQTTHPEPGSTKHSAAPPPAPDKVKALLPKLQDLPKEAEERARTVAELRHEITQLRGELRQSKQAVPPVKTETKEVRILKPHDLTRLEKAIERLDTIRDRMAQAQQVVTAEVGVLADAVKKVNQVPLTVSPSRPFGELPIPTTRPIRMSGDAPFKPPLPLGGQPLTGPEQRILDAIAWVESLGQSDADQSAVAFLAGYVVGGGAFNNPKGKLHTKGLVEYLSGGRIALTAMGRQQALAPLASLTTKELHDRVLQRLPGPHARILKVLLESYPEPMTNAELAKRAGYVDGGGAFNNPRGRLRSLGLIEYPDKHTSVASRLLFFER